MLATTSYEVTRKSCVHVMSDRPLNDVKYLVLTVAKTAAAKDRPRRTHRPIFFFQVNSRLYRKVAGNTAKKTSVRIFQPGNMLAAIHLISGKVDILERNMAKLV